MFKVLIPAIAALGFVAVAAQSTVAAPEAQAQLETPVMGWSVHYEGALAKLAYGVPNSDQLALMVTCMPGNATAAVYGDVRPQAARLMRTAMTSSAIDPLSGGDAEEFLMPANDPSLLSLAERGRMTVVGDAGVFHIAANAQERRVARDFLAYCSPGRA